MLLLVIGTLVAKDGHKYVGEWENDQYNGQGVLTYPNGDKYDGKWKNNKRNGKGNKYR